MIHVKSPDYPESARRARITGIVVVRAGVDKEGSVVSATSDGPEALRDPAERNCKEWRFSPGEVREIKITYDFRLEEPKVSSRPTADVSFDLPDKVTITSHALLANGDRRKTKPRNPSH